MKAVQALFSRSRRTGPVDPVLAAIAIALLGFGVVMVYSASVIEATVVYQDPQYFLKRQAVYAVIGLIAMFVVSRIDYRKLRPFTYVVLGAVIFLLGLSVTGLGHSGGGAARWLRLGPVNIQPSEAAKLALVLWLAYSLDKKQEQIKTFGVGILPHLIIAGGLMVLCLKQPDFGGAVMLLALTFTMLFVAGARLYWLVGAAMVGSAFGGWLIWSASYRYERILAWWNMDQHRQDLAYQPFQSVMSFGSGEASGLGLGHGFQVLYLPEAHNDFVSAIVGEELGFIGILALCATYLLLVARGVRAALAVGEDYGAYLAFGISVLFGLQALLNLGVAMAILPTKGLTLPFISYGGSSLLVSAVAMGVVLNISRGPPVTANVRTEAGTGPQPEASAMLASEANFAPESEDSGAGAETPAAANHAAEVPA